MQRVLTELIQCRLVTSEAAQVIGRYPAYCEEALVAELLKIEERFPDIAAELDRGRDEPSVGSADSDTGPTY
jgi:hypothetical protein